MKWRRFNPRGFAKRALCTRWLGTRSALCRQNMKSTPDRQKWKLVARERILSIVDDGRHILRGEMLSLVEMRILLKGHIFTFSQSEMCQKIQSAKKCKATLPGFFQPEARDRPPSKRPSQMCLPSSSLQQHCHTANCWLVDEGGSSLIFLLNKSET